MLQTEVCDRLSSCFTMVYMIYSYHEEYKLFYSHSQTSSSVFFIWPLLVLLPLIKVRVVAARPPLCNPLLWDTRSGLSSACFTTVFGNYSRLLVTETLASSDMAAIPLIKLIGKSTGCLADYITSAHSSPPPHFIHFMLSPSLLKDSRFFIYICKAHLSYKYTAKPC